MNEHRVRDAYAGVADAYIDLATSTWRDHARDEYLIRKHLVGLDGRVLDVGCGPGHWTAYLHAAGADVTGVDLVPEFIDYARATYPGPAFRVGSMTDLGLADHSLAGILAWYSTIHLPPSDVEHVLDGLHRLLKPGGTLVIGFFDSDTPVAEFDHRVITAYRWPIDELAARLAAAGFVEAERDQFTVAERPDRKYATLVARSRPGQLFAPGRLPSG